MCVGGGGDEGVHETQNEGQRKDTIGYICVAFSLREGHLCLEQAVPLSCGSIEIYETWTTGTFMKE